MLLAIINGIQFKLLGMLFSWHNEYLLLVLCNIFRGISHFVLYYLYASTNASYLNNRINMKRFIIAPGFQMDEKDEKDFSVFVKADFILFNTRVCPDYVMG